MGWQKRLSLLQRYILFFVIPYLEKRRCIRPGTRIFVSVRELRQISGCDKNGFKKAFEKLAEYELIEYIPGSSKRWNRKATEVKRMVNIRDP